MRTRIDQFGVSEPVVQKAGNDRIIVELPGIDDPQRAQERRAEVARSSQFQITDKTQALEKALPRLDAIVKEYAGSPADAGRRRWRHRARRRQGSAGAVHDRTRLAERTRQREDRFDEEGHRSR